MASKKREAILNTAETLFYEYGFHSIGLKRIIAEADVALMTFYNHFSSKEDLVVEVLKKRELYYWNLVRPQNRDSEKWDIDDVMNGHAKWLTEKGDIGCIFLRALEEYRGRSEAIEKLTIDHKQAFMDYLREVLSQNNRSPDLYLRIHTIIEGSTSMAEIIGHEKAIKEARRLLKTIIK
ncbi:TetR/AcrR family transcriptional regulator [Paenibacillus sp. UNC499MF]|uniref:TetR/AcrR family transcriptional regulator n=1 Tax=Paenibacillus sp. UNC499MF TaxID=1502751 RepID=UPI00089FA0AD|nr:TetR/AcrR family transcriptional regulator [Paenibacillus sp. UNC499MF]SEF70927.1 transcriptional regulator, TetR family [Paenibacillus sp. UNC499MF]